MPKNWYLQSFQYGLLWWRGWYWFNHVIPSCIISSAYPNKVHWRSELWHMDFSGLMGLCHPLPLDKWRNQQMKISAKATLFSFYQQARKPRSYASLENTTHPLTGVNCRTASLAKMRKVLAFGGRLSTRDIGQSTGFQYLGLHWSTKLTLFRKGNFLFQLLDQ